MQVWEELWTTVAGLVVGTVLRSLGINILVARMVKGMDDVDAEWLRPLRQVRGAGY